MPKPKKRTEKNADTKTIEKTSNAVNGWENGKTLIKAKRKHEEIKKKRINEQTVWIKYKIYVVDGVSQHLKFSLVCLFLPIPIDIDHTSYIQNNTKEHNERRQKKNNWKHLVHQRLVIYTVRTFTATLTFFLHSLFGLCCRNRKRLFSVFGSFFYFCYTFDGLIHMPWRRAIFSFWLQSFILISVSMVQMKYEWEKNQIVYLCLCSEYEAIMRR